MFIQLSDILFVAIVAWLAIELINGDWGGGKRSKTPAR